MAHCLHYVMLHLFSLTASGSEIQEQRGWAVLTRVSHRLPSLRAVWFEGLTGAGGPESVLWRHTPCPCCVAHPAPALPHGEGVLFHLVFLYFVLLAILFKALC